MQIFLLTHNPERSHRREMKKHKDLCVYTGCIDDILWAL